MAEYIEREKVIAKCKEIASCEWNHRASPVSWADAYEQFADDVEDIPAADVAPVVHGRWVHCDGASSLWYCSECGEKIRFNPTRKTYNTKKKPVHEVNKRCRNCGAKMDGERKDGGVS